MVLLPPQSNPPFHMSNIPNPSLQRDEVKHTYHQDDQTNRPSPIARVSPSPTAEIVTTISFSYTIPTADSSLQDEPINTTPYLIQRRNKRHLTPTKQCIPPTIYKHFKPSRKLFIHPDPRAVHYVRF